MVAQVGIKSDYASLLGWWLFHSECPCAFPFAYTNQLVILARQHIIDLQVWVSYDCVENTFHTFYICFPIMSGVRILSLPTETKHKSDNACLAGAAPHLGDDCTANLEYRLWQSAEEGCKYLSERIQWGASRGLVYLCNYPLLPLVRNRGGGYLIHGEIGPTRLGCTGFGTKPQSSKGLPLWSQGGPIRTGKPNLLTKRQQGCWDTGKSLMTLSVC
jgi:hypothetical protein